MDRKFRYSFERLAVGGSSRVAQRTQVCWLLWNGAHSFEELRSALPSWSRETIQLELEALVQFGMIRPAAGPQLPGCADYVMTLKGEHAMKHMPAVVNLPKGERRKPSIWE